MEHGILNQEYSHMLANRIDHYMGIQHQETINRIIAEEQMSFVKTFNLIPFKDGNMWCVLLGENLQEGISGFGETPLMAVLDFNKNFRTEKISKP
jgi:hypothetical protein